MEFTKRAQAPKKVTLNSLFQAIREKERGVLLGDDPEDLHDYRVALRRTRTAVSRLKNQQPKSGIECLSKELSWLARCTCACRDLDVFLEDFASYRHSRPLATRLQLLPLVNLLYHVRLVEHSKLVTTMTSPQYSDLVDRWELLVVSPASIFTETLSSPESRKGTPALQGASLIARKSVADAAIRLLHNAPNISAKPSGKELHRIRIRCKKLRYTLEFFKDELPRTELNHQVNLLKQLQNCLGRINDLEAQSKWLKTLSKMLVKDNVHTPGPRGAAEELGTHLLAQQALCVEEFHPLFSHFSSRQNRIQLEELVNLPLDEPVPEAT